MDKPNLEDTGAISLSAGVGSLHAEGIGNLRFRQLDFEGGLAEGIGAKAVTDAIWFNSTIMYRFVRKTDAVFVTPDFDKSQRHVPLEIQSGLGSVAVRWAK